MEAIALLLGQSSSSWEGTSYRDCARRGYLGNPNAFACITQLARAVSGIPWIAYTWEGKERVNLEDERALAFIRRPNPGTSFASMLYRTVEDLQIAGQSFWHGAWPNEVRRLHPESVEVKLDTWGDPKEYVYRSDATSTSVTTIAPEDMLWLRHDSPITAGKGFAPIKACGDSIDLNSGVRKMNASLLKNGGLPSLVLSFINESVVLNETQKEDLKASIDARFSGTENAGRPLLVPWGLKADKVGLSPAEMQFAMLDQSSMDEICRVLGVPQEIIGGGKKTYENLDQAEKMFYRGAVLPLLDYVEGELNAWEGMRRQLGEGVMLGYDEDAVEALQEDRGPEVDRAIRAVELGILTRDEARNVFGISEDLPGGIGSVPTVASAVMPLEGVVGGGEAVEAAPALPPLALPAPKALPAPETEEGPNGK
jgi:HK97 family phage portal protein